MLRRSTVYEHSGSNVCYSTARLPMSYISVVLQSQKQGL
jgi:hypothetical protein